MNIRLTANFTDAELLLDGVIDRLNHPGPALVDIAGEVQHRIHSAFELERDPVTLTSWPPLKPATLAQRQATGHDGPMLQVTRALLGTTQVTPESRAIEVTTGVEYGLTHQHGDPSRNIPQRRFAGISPEDQIQFKNMLRVYILRSR